jgi:hypothetical protein
MSGQDLYDSWRRKRAAAEPREGFADRVMDRVRRLEAERGAAPTGLSSAGEDLAGWLFSRRYVAAALLIAAAIIGLVRFGSVTAMILATLSGGY